MEADALEALIQDGETTTVEFKIAPPRAAELAERICGFANGLGGYLIIGVADQTWRIVGVKNSADAVDSVLQAARLCKPPVRFDPSQPQVVEIKGKLLVVAHIPPNNGMLHQAGGVFWIRRGTHTVPLEADEIESFFHNRGTLAWETRPVALATLDDFDMNLVEGYIAQRHNRSKERGRLPDVETLLQKSGCAVLVKEGDNAPILRPTNAGLLLFGQNTQDYLIQAEVICVVFGDEVGLRRYIDRRNLSGSITRQVDDAEEFFRKNIQVGARIEGFHRIDEPEYSLEALREAVVNAVVHRDYSLRGEAIRIFFYSNRIEIHSPGLLLPGVRLEDLRQGRVLSRPRNPILAAVLRDFPGGYMERLGSGISFMINQMRHLGKPDPEFSEQSEFVVTFWKELQNENGVLLAPSKPTPETFALPAPVIPASPVLDLGEMTQAQRQELALRYVVQHGAITNKEYRKLTATSDSTALRDLEALVEQGSLRAIGSKRGRKYIR